MIYYSKENHQQNINVLRCVDSESELSFYTSTHWTSFYQTLLTKVIRNIFKLLSQTQKNNRHILQHREEMRQSGTYDRLKG